MARCQANKKDGMPCKNKAAQGSNFCHAHKNQKTNNTPALAIGGALLGNIIAPGIGGAIVGALIGGLIGASSDKDSDNE